jgi:predicted ATPase/class 3 adenylate cyclase
MMRAEARDQSEPHSCSLPFKGRLQAPVDLCATSAHDPGVRELPTGTVTFLFTDIEGSTRLLHELGSQAFAEALAQHRHVVRAEATRCGGVEVDTQGDAFFVAFANAPCAIRAAQAITAGLASGPIRVRMGVHTGTPLLTEEGYVGADVHRGARIAAAGHGGQVVISPTTAELVGAGFSLVPLGAHRLKDFDHPVSLFQLADGEFPPLKTIANTNLPTPASSFLGREDELVEADRGLATTRLLTVTGPGGAGKSRFALELARRAREERFSDYRDGVFWVPLAPLRDPGLVLDTIAQAIGAKDDIRGHISSKQMLLLLDNFEQVVPAAGDLASLLEACPNLTALVTSRELLRVRGEIGYDLPPLADDEGVLLFCERARVTPGEDVLELCRRLEGLPLAIELAAARARILSPAELVVRLSERLDLLKGGRDVDPRQQTLRAAIEWSHELLAEKERKLFRRLSVFAGSWTIESSTEVVDADLDTVQSLFDKSLLRRSEDRRFFMLETIREYARERLEESGEVEEMSRRHGEVLLLGAEDALEEHDRWEGARQLEPERENLRAAMRWSLDGGGSKTGLVLATAYARLCVYRGPFSEGRFWLDAALRNPGSEQASAERVKALLAAASLAERQGDLEPAREFANAALSLAKSIDDSTSVGTALAVLGTTSGVGGDYERSESLLREALAVFSHSRDERNVRETLALLGWVALARRDYAQARPVIEEALELSRRADDSRGVFYGVGNLGHVAAREGRFEEALQLLREALLIGQQQDIQSEMDTLQDVAAVAAAQRYYEQAAAMLGGADALREGTEAEQELVAKALREETLSILESNLEADQLTAAWERGRAMTLEQVVAYAVEFIDAKQGVAEARGACLRASNRPSQPLLPADTALP